MLVSTLSRLNCLCGGALELHPSQQAPVEVRSGNLVCAECSSAFLILAGIPLLVSDTHDYLMSHVKGISKIVKDSEIPEEFRGEFVEAKTEIEAEHIEEDLEAERVNALYLMNHYLRTDAGGDWWKPILGKGSPLIDQLVRDYWDRGPFAQIGKWVSESGRFDSAIELGCGVGGLHRVLRPNCGFYLGVDSSFASIAIARHLALGAPYPDKLRIPEDLLAGSVSREVTIPVGKADGSADFVVADLQHAAPVSKSWDLSISLNTIDMLEDPAALPRLQAEMLKEGGVAIQSCPYIWHEWVSRGLREQLPQELRGDSARAVEWLYEEAGFKIEKKADHVPWLFFKHLRQLEVYSVHAFSARKS